VLWLVALGVVVGLSWRFASRRVRALAAGAAVASVGILVTGETFHIPATVVWQGRHVLPLLLGAVLLLAASARPTDAAGDSGGRDGAAGTRLRRAGPPLLALLVVLQVWAFAYAVRHYTVGRDGPLNPLSFLFDTEWSPPLLPVWAYLVVFTVSLGLLARQLWTTANRVDQGLPDVTSADGTTLPDVRRMSSSGPRATTRA
jgi:hypothetical protein